MAALLDIVDIRTIEPDVRFVTWRCEVPHNVRAPSSFIIIKPRVIKRPDFRWRNSVARHNRVLARDLRSFIQVEILNDPKFPIVADQDLLLSETLNSLSVTLLIAHLEIICEVQIPPEDVTLENFSTLNSIETYVNRLTGSSI